ncbi:MAG: pilus assembly protein [Alphaproteobacteria bacterium]|nr:pilus assembly protein [Alphaproteobacteria bacterium]
MFFSLIKTSRFFARLFGKVPLVGSLFRARNGVAAVEFALLFPVAIIAGFGILEIARMIVQTNAVTKGLRAGALYAAHAEFPLSATSLQNVDNIVKTGTLNGVGALLVDTWSDPDAKLTITIGSVLINGESVPIINMSASVPFSNMVPGIKNMIGLDGLTITATHQQVYIGD